MSEIILNPEHFEKDTNAIKSLIHLLNGKPDSSTEFFEDAVLVYIDSLKSLSDKIDAKLNTLTSENLLVISVSLSDNKTLEFANWKAFYEYDWAIDATVRNINFKWDFFIKLPDYLAPQRHALNLKVMSDCHFTDLLPLMFSRDIERAEKLREQGCVMIARVDFINHTLGQELLNIVRSWNKSLKRNSLNFKKFKKVIKWVEPIFRVSLPIFGLLLIGIFCVNSADWLKPVLGTESNFIILMVLTGMTFMRFAWEFSSKVTTQAQGRLLKLGELPNVILTSGDKNEFDKKSSKQTNYLVRIIFEQSIGIIMNAILLVWITVKH